MALGPKHPGRIRGAGHGLLLSTSVINLVDVIPLSGVEWIGGCPGEGHAPRANRKIVRQELFRLSQLIPLPYYKHPYPPPQYEHHDPPSNNSYYSCSMSRHLSKISKIILLCNLFC